MRHEARPILCYVTDRSALAPAGSQLPVTAALLEAIRQAAAAGVDWIQLREKDLPARELGDLVRRALQEAGSRARVIVNDRLDAAVAAGAAGVHLGGASLPAAEVVRWCRAGHTPNEFLIGVSCHSLAEARAAERDGADYLFFGPVFATPSKFADGPPQGMARLEEVSQGVRIPVLAIGGITAENAAECLRAGARGVAAIRLFQQARDVVAVVAQLRCAC